MLLLERNLCLIDMDSLQLRLIKFWRIVASLFSSRSSAVMFLWTWIQLGNSAKGANRANPFERKVNTSVASQKYCLNLLVSTNIRFKIHITWTRILNFSIVSFTDKMTSSKSICEWNIFTEQNRKTRRERYTENDIQFLEVNFSRCSVTLFFHKYLQFRPFFSRKGIVVTH